MDALDEDEKMTMDRPDYRTVTDIDLELIGDALGYLYAHGPARRDEIVEMCLRTGFPISGDGY